MSKRKLSKKEERNLKNKAGALFLIALYYSAVAYWMDSTKRQKINIVIWWTIGILFALSQSQFNLPYDYQVVAIAIYVLNLLWGLNNLMVRHKGYSNRQAFIKSHTNFPIPNSPRFNTWFAVIFWIILGTLAILNANEML